MSFRILQLKDLDIIFNQKGNDITMKFHGAHIKKQWMTLKIRLFGPRMAL